jgi:hypothetical protein
MSFSADFPTVVGWLSALPPNSPLKFLLLRQAGLAEALLLVVLLYSLWRERSRRDLAAPQAEFMQEIRHAA